MEAAEEALSGPNEVQQVYDVQFCTRIFSLRVSCSTTTTCGACIAQRTSRGLTVNNKWSNLGKVIGELPVFFDFPVLITNRPADMLMHDARS